MHRIKKVKVDTLIVFSKSQFGDTVRLFFPLFHTGNKHIDSILSHTIIDSLNCEPSEGTYKEKIQHWAEDIIVESNFNVNCNNNRLLSVTHFSEGCGAYCSYSEDHFNFNIKTGKLLHLTQLVDSSIFDLYRKDKAVLYLQQKEEYRQMLDGSFDDFDSETYDLVMDYMDTWRKDTTPIEYYITDDKLVIEDHFYLPHVIQCFAFSSKFEYPLSEIDSLKLIDF